VTSKGEKQRNERKQRKSRKFDLGLGRVIVAAQIAFSAHGNGGISMSHRIEAVLSKARGINRGRSRSVALITLVGAVVLAVTFVVSHGTAGAANDYAAEIRWTSHGIPHITAKDFGSLGFGEGYAFAQDHLCSLADQVVRVRGERARYFGAGERNRNLNSDVSIRALGIVEQAKEILRTMPQESRDIIEGYAAGYNTYLREKKAAGVTGWCQGKDWVYEITPVDVIAYGQAVVATSTNFTDMIATAVPPKSEVARASGLEIPDFEQASNGWAIGAARSESGKGMLLANPHYPWVGSNRFWEKHLVVPGQLNIYGVGLLGNPGVAIGFNEAVAWTHTVSAGKRYVLYSLDLVPGSPTRYYYDGKEREMTSKVVTIDVKQADGTLKKVEQRVFFSHYGPIVNLAGLEWTAKRAVAMRDANGANTAFFEQRQAMSKARSLEEFKQAHAKYNAIPWVNTIAASSDGRAWYVDASATPYLSAQSINAFLKRADSDLVTKTAWQRGVVLLDGSNSMNEWMSDSSTRPGVLPYSKMPQLERTDFVFNANDSYWLANPMQLLTGFSPLQGGEATPRSLRTRMNAVVLSDTTPQGPAGKDGKFSLDELASAAFNNRSMPAELLRREVVERCNAAGSVSIEGQDVDLRPACKILEAWDGKYELTSVGPVIWREFISLYSGADLQRSGFLFRTDFDATQPVATPKGLADAKGGKDQAVINLGRAVQLLKSNGIALDTPLGKLQYSDKNGGRIPLHGGEGTYEGITNFVNYAPNTTTLEPFSSPVPVKGSRFLGKDGYLVNRGSSFVMALEYTDKGPRAVALLTYSQSGDPKSPLFYDQTELYSAKKWRKVQFTEKEVAADIKGKPLKVTGKRQ
jgi:acyl-homoserine-lactone acylase